MSRRAVDTDGDQNHMPAAVTISLLRTTVREHGKAHLRMARSVPRFTGARSVADVSTAEWVIERLLSFEFGPLRVGREVPVGYPAYARLLHPVRRRAGAPGSEMLRWASVAAKHGVALHPEVRFNEVVSWVQHPGQSLPPWPYEFPSDGSLEEEECRVLAELLASSTGTADDCWFCLWDGFGYLGLRTRRGSAPGARRAP